MSRMKLPDIKSRVEGAILARLWHKILIESNVHRSLEHFVDRYVSKSNDMSNRVKSVKRKSKASLTDNVLATEITWKTFLDLIFNFLNVKEITLTVKLKHSNGDVRLHDITFNGPEDMKERNDK